MITIGNLDPDLRSELLPKQADGFHSSLEDVRLEKGVMDSDIVDMANYLSYFDPF